MLLCPCCVQVKMTAKTNNRSSGADACQRADVEIVIPAKCMLSDTTLTIKIANAASMELDATLKKANMKQLTLTNTHGKMTTSAASSEKITLETSDGSIDASGLQVCE